MGRRKYRIVYNPVRDEYVDSLTGTQVTPLAVGAAPTGRRFIRIRPAPGEPMQAVYVHGDDVDERRATYGLDRATRAHYEGEARKQAKEEKRRRARPAFREDEDVLLHRMGIPTTFKTARQGADEFIANNSAVFEAEAMEDPDIGDVTRDFMDRLEVRRRGGRHVRLSQTKRGREILAGGPTRVTVGRRLLKGGGAGIVREMLVYLYGKAGKSRRYADVPWDTIQSYLSLVWNTAHGGGAAQADQGAPISWWPLASGHYGGSGSEMLAAVVEEHGVTKAQHIADSETSKRLYEMARSLDRILSPPKGPAGARGRKILRCIPGDHRKLIRHRARVLREWAQYPERIPEWSCVPENWGSLDTYACSFPGLREDVARIRAACEEPYDPEWPNELRRKYKGERDLVAKLHGTGVMPIGFDPAADPSFAVAGVPESLDLPWEAAANPGRRRAVNPAALRRRLTRR